MRALLPLLAVAACGPVQGGFESGVAFLSPGMSASDVTAVLGEAAPQVARGTDPAVECRSYRYDVGSGAHAHYAHVIFRDGQVVEASDDHHDLCELDA
ncbi:hypothetical protein [Pontivivens ytuae]|uniref:Uncharacterized protein n=1 Tax=Pontivivens ytuae TaxID=2789856 RepID=A0A7S9LVD2_9RHOB|nr:hypothetical protein [Pontivivens ytuae]QPH55804.1 hypothetical protein I0K15_08815 [Pontivivens ytuae]